MQVETPFATAKYGITCVQNSDGTQDCGRPSKQCADFNKNPDPDVANYNYAWLVGGETEPTLIPHVNYRTALFMEKTMTALYILNKVREGKLPDLPPRHKSPCFKKDDPFDILQPERVKRADKWLKDAKTKY